MTSSFVGKTISFQNCLLSNSFIVRSDNDLDYSLHQVVCLGSEKESE